jgi:hypothetical protein
MISSPRLFLDLGTRRREGQRRPNARHGTREWPEWHPANQQRETATPVAVLVDLDKSA